MLFRGRMGGHIGITVSVPPPAISPLPVQPKVLRYTRKWKIDYEAYHALAFYFISLLFYTG